MPKVQLKPPLALSGDFPPSPTPELSTRAASVPNPAPTLAEIAPPKPFAVPLEARQDASGFWVVGDRTFRPAGYVTADNGRAWGASFRGALRRGLSADAAELEADVSWIEPPLTDLDRHMPAWLAFVGRWRVRGVEAPESWIRSDRDFALARAGLFQTPLPEIPMQQTEIPGANLPTEDLFTSERPAIAESLPPGPVPSGLAEQAAAGDPVVRSGLEGPKRRGRPPGSKTRPRAPAATGPGSVPAFVPADADRRARARDVATDGEGGPGVIGQVPAVTCSACGNHESNAIHADDGAHGHRFAPMQPDRPALEGLANALPPAAASSFRAAAGLAPSAPPPRARLPRAAPAPDSAAVDFPIPSGRQGSRAEPPSSTEERARRTLGRVGHEIAELLEPIAPWHRRHALAIAAAALRGLDTERRIGNELDGRPLEDPHPRNPGARHPLRLAEATAELRDRLRETLEGFDALTLECEGGLGHL